MGDIFTVTMVECDTVTTGQGFVRMTKELYKLVTVSTAPISKGVTIFWFRFSGRLVRDRSGIVFNNMVSEGIQFLMTCNAFIT